MDCSASAVIEEFGEVEARKGYEPYQKIFMYENGTKNDQPKVTFVDSTDHNWSYHDGGTDPYITELFHVHTFGETMVTVYAYVPPPIKDGKQISWFLSVSEDLRNESVAAFPTFQPSEEKVEKTDYGIFVHQTFSVEVSEDGLIALSFLKNNHDKVYLVPSTTSTSTTGLKIQTLKTTDPQFFFSMNVTGRVTLPSKIGPAKVEDCDQ